MAMNFKIFNDKEAVSAYAADLLRKQVHSNKNSVLALENHKDLEWTYEKFVGEIKRYPADLSQVYITTVNNDGDISILNKLSIPSGQFYTDGKEGSLEHILKDKKAVNLALLYLGKDSKLGFTQSINNELLFGAREIVIAASGKESAEAVKDLYNASENNSGGYSSVKSHRMVTVVLDTEAAAELDEDIKEYYSYKFA